jgi:hypothetical protein
MKSAPEVTGLEPIVQSRPECAHQFRFGVGGRAFWDACAALLVLRGLESWAVGHLRYCNALHLRMGEEVSGRIGSRLNALARLP